jgi:hypothetical protein
MERWRIDTGGAKGELGNSGHREREREQRGNGSMENEKPRKKNECPRQK